MKGRANQKIRKCNFKTFMIPKIFKMCNKKEYKDRTNFRTFNKGKILDLTLNRDQLYLQKRSHRKFLKIYQNMEFNQNTRINLILISTSKVQHCDRSLLI
jgi:hypothetical protein